MIKNSDVDEELKELKRDLAAAYRKGDKSAVADIQERIDGLSKKNLAEPKLKEDFRNAGKELYGSKLNADTPHDKMEPQKIYSYNELYALFISAHDSPYRSIQDFLTSGEVEKVKDGYRLKQ